ncbi:EmrB/QacA family drug resistance transporter [Neoasaia chiangmaiensis NBRC 101099]|uniref:Multidrug transporter n=1 Tax=Neoasaia chiangmaiensis TaxID=320497 RepID=A0A1U9KPA0_9PROT|nr:DHA2 family efflux MFS transporter permease subunit [Neoasaia chiangmaiensis]AQS87638.1 multidrug transporter [Neoasaia chiangmaiensis]GBR42026.1 EmrB/QacA family drug resistance transporter [Neoasaia chiangmaiensis NBRC 101099]GEN14208.1 multidrug resistance protein B [Neoasaia chiangmaiensis]
MSSESNAAEVASAPPTLDSKVLKIAAVVVLGSIMSILDTTIINVAIRDLSQHFHVGINTTQWIATGYMLALAAVIPLTGWAADRFGTKRLYLTSIALFLAGSALSGAAWSMNTLILFRVLQGLGGGMIMPAGMTILSQAAGAQRMGRVMGIVGVPMLLGPIAGPILGGWLVDNVSWRWIFFVNLPIGAIALPVAQYVLAPDKPGPQHKLDWPGALMLSPGLAVFVFGLAEITAAGSLGNIGDDACLISGAILIVGFVLHAARRTDALIDVRLFARRPVAASALTMFLFGMAFFGMTLLLPLYFQIVRQQTPFGAGMHLAAQGIGAMLAMPLAARLTDSIGAGRIVLAGLGTVAIAMAVLSDVHADTALPLLEGALFLNGLGMGCVMMPCMSAAMAQLQRHEIARATSGLNVLQRVGGSIGTALLTVILAHEMTRAGASAHPGAQTAPTADMLPAISHAFGHTIRFSLGVIILAILVAMRLPMRKTTSEAERQ